MTFRRSLFGYNRRAVDQYVAEQEAVHGRYIEQQGLHSRYVAEQAAARRTLEAEIDNLRAAEPMLKVNQEVSSLLTSFASTVSTMREQAEREAASTRTEADGYAEHRREEADRLFHDQRARATAVAEETLRSARHEAVTLAQNQTAVEQALRDVAQGVFAWLTTLERLKEATELPWEEGAGAPDGRSGGHPAGAGTATESPSRPGPSATGPAPAAAPTGSNLSGPGSTPGPSSPLGPATPADARNASPAPGGAPPPAGTVPEPGGPPPDRGNIVDFRPRPDQPDQPGNGDT
jgi:hypothetical protein